MVNSSIVVAALNNKDLSMVSPWLWTHILFRKINTWFPSVAL